MIEADLAVHGIGELATPIGSAPKVGTELGRLRIIEEAAIAARAGRIVFVGTERDYHATVRLEPGAQVLDAQGGTVLPGFVDAHTHLPFAGWREKEFEERLHGATYSEIAARGGGILSTVARTREIDEAALTAIVRQRLDAMLRLGTTTVEGKSGYGLTVRDELKQLRSLAAAAEGHPVEVVRTFLGAHTVPAEHRARREDYVALLVEEMLPAVAQESLAEYADAFVDRHAFSVDEARRVLTAAREHGLGVRVHADQLADDGGAALAAELGAISADHLEHASAHGLAQLARAGTCGVLLPAATFFLRMREAPPGRRLVDAGVAVVVASDFNPGTCPSESMQIGLVFACLTAGLGVDEAITASTLNAAYSLGRSSEIGSLEPGKRANFVLHDMPSRYHLVYRLGLSRVATVVVDGRIV